MGPGLISGFLMGFVLGVVTTIVLLWRFKANIANFVMQQMTGGRKR